MKGKLGRLLGIFEVSLSVENSCKISLCISYMKVFHTFVNTIMDLSHVSAPLSQGIMLYFCHVYNETVYLCTVNIVSLKFKAATCVAMTHCSINEVK